MKILYFHQYFNTTEMAGGTRSYEMAKCLVAADHEVHIITTWREPTEKTDWWQESIDGIEVHWLPVRYDNTMSFAGRIGAFFKFALKAGQRGCRIGGDLVFATSTPLTIILPGYRAARRLRTPLVFEVRDLWPKLPIAMGALKNPLTRWLAICLERFAYARSDAIVALSPGMAEGVIQLGYPEDKITIIPNGCDLDLFTPSEVAANKFRTKHPELGTGQIILYAGTLGRINGVGYLAQLAHLMKDRFPEVRFVTIGHGSEAERTHQLAKQLGVLDVNFFQYPAMSKQELVGAFAAASVSCSLFIDLPAMWANSANKFFDTLASGTAVAINYQGWQADLIDEHECGVVLNADPDKAADDLSLLLSDREALAETGRRARQLAQVRFSRDKLGQEFVSVLQNAYDKSRQV
ncbi:glycosyltransferase family 4 protein [Yoonia sp. SDW83-1]|uniref:glycosyltransferase family 4 protein n=1 Tax=Yoonia sp. SDW83-1 TaxID=3366945 RepID=UPI00398C36EA